MKRIMKVVFVLVVAAMGVVAFWALAKINSQVPFEDTTRAAGWILGVAMALLFAWSLNQDPLVTVSTFGAIFITVVTVNLSIGSVPAAIAALLVILVNGLMALTRSATWFAILDWMAPPKPIADIVAEMPQG